MPGVSIGPLNRRGLALFFSLMKRTKNQVSKEASLRSWPLPGSSGKTSGCNTFAFRRTSHRFSKSLLMPLQTR
jgi:hypothetical protein